MVSPSVGQVAAAARDRRSLRRWRRSWSVRGVGVYRADLGVVIVQGGVEAARGFGGGPGGQQGQIVRGGRGGVGGVGGKHEAGGGDEVHRVVGQFHVADDGMVERLGAATVQTHVVGSPAGAERLAAGGEFADEFGEVGVVRVAAGLGAQQRDGGGERAVI